MVARTDLESSERGSWFVSARKRAEKGSSDIPPTTHSGMSCVGVAPNSFATREDRSFALRGSKRVQSVRGFVVDVRRGRGRSEVALGLSAAAGWNTFCGEGKVALSFEQWDRLGDWPDRQWRVTAGCTNTMCTRYIAQRQREWHPSP